MKNAWLVTLLSITIGYLIYTGWNPYDRLTWLLEVMPVGIGMTIFAATYKRFPPAEKSRQIDNSQPGKSPITSPKVTGLVIHREQSLLIEFFFIGERN